jgi:glycosyltransferase involved in cell wall biosynthesis
VKRILEIVLNAEGTVGGEQRHVLQILDGLDRERITPEVVTWDVPAFVDELSSRGVPTLSVSAKRILDWPLLRRVEARMKQGRYDLVHSHGHRAGLLGRFAAIRTRAPRIVWTCHLAENKADKNPLVAWGYRRVLRYLDAHTDVTVAVSSFLRDWLVEQGIDGSRIVVIPNGVDCEVFKPQARDEALLAALGLDPGIPIVGTVARLTEQKGVETLVDAAAQIERDVPSVQFVIVGTGPLEAAVRARASELSSRVVFLGERADIPELLALFDVAVVPSLWEGAFCYTMLEAMAARRPVVCSDISLFTDVVRSGSEALIYPAGDSPALAAAVVELLENPDVANRLAEAGMRLARERFSMEHSRNATIEIYERLLGEERS